MGVTRGDIVIEGIDIIIQRDLDKHKSLLEMNNLNIQSFEGARSNEINKKRFYGEQKGKRKYRDKDMDIAIEQMTKNINHLSRRITVTMELRKENTIIVDTLTEQLKQYYINLKKLSEAQKQELNANHS